MSFMTTIPAGDTQLTQLAAQITTLQALTTPKPDQLNQIEQLQRQLVDTAVGSGKLIPSTILGAITYSVSPNDQIGANLVAQIAVFQAAVNGSTSFDTSTVQQNQQSLSAAQAQLLDVLMSSGRMTANAILTSASLSYLGGYPNTNVN